MAGKLNAGLILEETDRHPFIADFYRDPERSAFQTELGFVLIHYHQLQQAQHEGVFKGLVVSDFFFAKDQIFADINLKGEEASLFRSVFQYLSERVPLPSAIVYLRAPIPFLKERIRARGREMERNIPDEYLIRLEEAYESFFSCQQQVPTLTLDADEYDFLKRDQDVDNVVTKLKDLGFLG